jgi:hypothetical protein
MRKMGSCRDCLRVRGSYTHADVGEKGPDGSVHEHARPVLRGAVDGDVHPSLLEQRPARIACACG